MVQDALNVLQVYGLQYIGSLRYKTKLASYLKAYCIIVATNYLSKLLFVLLLQLKLYQQIITLKYVEKSRKTYNIFVPLSLFSRLKMSKSTLRSIFLNLFVRLMGQLSLSTLRSSDFFHNDPAAHQDHCDKCRIRTRDLCPRSLVHYQ